MAEILLNVPAEEYHRRELGVASSGVLRALTIGEKTPAYVKAWADGLIPDKDTAARIFGRAYHVRVLEPEVYAASFVLPPVDPPKDLRHLRNAKKKGEATLESIDFWDAWDEQHRGMIQMPAAHFQQIEDMRGGLLLNDEVADLLFAEDPHAVNESTIRWVDKATGVPCKARPDRWKRRERKMLDLKSAVDIGEQAFRRAFANMGYHVQAGHYPMGAAAVGEPLDEFVIVAQGKEPPYLSRLFRLDPAAETRGLELRADGLDILKACRESGKWPGHVGTTELSLPAWAMGETMEIGYVE